MNRANANKPWRWPYRLVAASSLLFLTACTSNPTVGNTPTEHVDTMDASLQRICDNVLPVVDNLRIKDPADSNERSLFSSPSNLLGVPDLYLTAWNVRLASSSETGNILTDPQRERTIESLTASVVDRDVRDRANVGLPELYALSLGVQALKGADATIPASVAEQVEALRVGGQYKAGSADEPSEAATFLAVEALDTGNFPIPAEVSSQVNSKYENLKEAPSSGDIIATEEPILSAFLILNGDSLESSAHRRVEGLTRSWLKSLSENGLEPSMLATMSRLIAILLPDDRADVLKDVDISGVSMLPSGYASIDGGNTADPQITYYLLQLGAIAPIPPGELSLGYVNAGWHRLPRPNIPSAFFSTFIQKSCGVEADTQATLESINQLPPSSIQQMDASSIMMVCSMHAWNSGLSEETLTALGVRSEELLSAPQISAIDQFDLEQARGNCGHSGMPVDTDQRKPSNVAEEVASMALKSRGMSTTNSQLKPAVCPVSNPSDIWSATWEQAYCSSTGTVPPSVAEYESDGLFVLSPTDEDHRSTLGSLAVSIQWATLNPGGYVLGFNAQ